MKNLEDKSIIFARYLASVKKCGDEERIKKAIAMGKSWLKNHPDDRTVRQAYLSLLKDECENKEEIIEAIEDTASWLKNQVEDKNVRSVYICLVRNKGFFRIEDIKQVLEDAEQWMKNYGPHPVFQDYITLIAKIEKTGINLHINTELVKKFGYGFINSSKGKNIRVVRDFADFLRTEKCFDEAKKIYEDLLKVRTDPETRSNVYLSYGEMLLGQAMSLELTMAERAEKLKEAEEKFREAFKVNGTHYVALTFLSIALREEGKKDEAAEELKKAEMIARVYKEKKGEKFSPGEIPYKIGVFYLEFNRYEDAIYWLKIACNRDSGNFANWWRLGYAKIEHALILKEKGFPKESKMLLNEALLDLETSLKKAPKLLQLPAREDIPNLVEECKKLLLK